MKRVSMLLLILLFAFNNINASKEQLVKTNLNSVKVFLRGAELIHTAKVNLDKGVIDLSFTGLASNLDQNSINVSAKGDMVILSVVQKFDYLQSPEKNPQQKSLEDSLEFLNNKMTAKQNEMSVLYAEQELIFANKEIGSKEKGVSIVELQKMADFYRKKLTEIKTQISSLDRENKKIQKDIDRIKKQLDELNNKLNQPTNQIVVTVSSNSQNYAEFTLSYLTYDAGWQPAYDIRVDKINSPANLSFKANVRQNSGLDWNNVNVVLSTRNPVQGNNKPELYPWFIDFTQPILYREHKAGGARKVQTEAFDAEVQELAAPAPTMADYMEVSQTQLAVEFVPTLKYSIPADGKQHIVALQDYNVPAKYEYYSAPKLADNAFLVTYLSSWNEYNLLPGQANIYFENSYVGQSYINPQTSKDTLSISLGRDQGITITRQQLKDYSEDKFLSSDIERFFAFDIVIKNNKNIPVSILAEEQIPISKNEDIEVKLIDISGGVYTESDGKVKWNVQVDPSKSVTKKLVYSVRYPKDRIIPGL